MPLTSDNAIGPLRGPQVSSRRPLARPSVTRRAVSRRQPTNSRQQGPQDKQLQEEQPKTRPTTKTSQDTTTKPMTTTHNQNPQTKPTNKSPNRAGIPMPPGPPPHEFTGTRRLGKCTLQRCHRRLSHQEPTRGRRLSPAKWQSTLPTVRPRFSLHATPGATEVRYQGPVRSGRSARHVRRLRGRRDRATGRPLRPPTACRTASPPFAFHYPLEPQQASLSNSLLESRQGDLIVIDVGGPR